MVLFWGALMLSVFIYNQLQRNAPLASRLIPHFLLDNVPPRVECHAYGEPWRQDQDGLLRLSLAPLACFIQAGEVSSPSMLLQRIRFPGIA